MGTPASLETSSNSTNLLMQHKHKTASTEYDRRKSFFSLQTTLHEQFELLIISDNSILLSSEKNPFSERNDQLQVIPLCGHDTYSCAMVLPTSIMQILTSV